MGWLSTTFPWKWCGREVPPKMNTTWDIVEPELIKPWSWCGRSKTINTRHVLLVRAEKEPPQQRRGGLEKGGLVIGSPETTVPAPCSCELKVHRVTAGTLTCVPTQCSCELKVHRVSARTMTRDCSCTMFMRAESTQSVS